VCDILIVKENTMRLGLYDSVIWVLGVTLKVLDSALWVVAKLPYLLGGIEEELSGWREATDKPRTNLMFKALGLYNATYPPRHLHHA
jgi:hypothetical protein